MRYAAILLPLLSLPVLQGDLNQSFKSDIRKLAAQNDKDGMGKLVKAHEGDAIAWIVATCEELADRTTDDLEAFAKELREAWAAGIGSGFADREYENLKGLGANRRDRHDLKGRFDAAALEYRGNLERKDSFAFQNVVDELDVVAPGLEQVGDLYRASQAWILQAQASDAPVRGESADLYKACTAYASAIAAREKIDLKDSVHAEISKRHAALLAAGHCERGAAPAKPSEPGPSASTPTGAPLAIATSFEAVPSLEAYQRPNYMGDDVHLLWGPIPLKAKGSSATFTRIADAPQILRAGASDIRVDVDGNGRGDDSDPKIALAGNPLLVQITVGKDDAARPWAFLAQVGSQRDQYQQIEVNVEPSDTLYTIYTTSAASVVGSVAGVPIRIFDDTMDAIYGSKPETWAEPGLSKENFQPEMDSIAIGTSKRARPWSEVQEIGGKWYKLAADAAGKECTATPITVETGILKLDFKGPAPAPAWVVVRGSGELLQNSYFDLVEGASKGVTVPVGSYKLFYGEMRKGKKKQVQKILILPGKTTESVDVAKGKTSVLPLGAPFGFDFRFTRAGAKLTVEGRSAVIVGRSAERYERTWNCVPRPEVIWRKKGSKSGSKPEKMPTIGGTQDLEKFGWDAAWSPLDLALDLKQDPGPIEVQLVEKKNDLFGKVESAWKEE